jgi:hypothetical protein
MQLGGWAMAQEVPELNTVPMRARIAILPAQIIVDGHGDPVLGQSLGDILNAALLTSSAVELLDAGLPLAGSPPARAIIHGAVAPALEKSGPASGAVIFPNPVPPSPSPDPPVPVTASAVPSALNPVETGKAVGADFVVIPTVVGAGQDFRLTLRQVQIPSGRIRAIINEKTNRGIKGVYALAENVAFRLIPELPAPLRRGTGPTIIDHPVRFTQAKATAEPAPVSLAELAMAPKALNAISPAKLAAIEATRRSIGDKSGASPSNAAGAEPIAVGSIANVSLDWSFCTFSPAKGANLPPGTALFVCAAGNPDHTIKLSVTRTEGNSIIADFGQNPRAADIVQGDKVYQWQTPAARP